MFLQGCLPSCMLIPSSEHTIYTWALHANWIRVEVAKEAGNLRRCEELKNIFFCTVYFVTQMIDSFHSFPKRFYFLFTSLGNFDWWALESFTMGSTLGSKHWLLPGSNPGFVCLSSALCGMSQLHIIEHLYVLKHWYVQVSTMSSESSCWDNLAHPVHALLMLSCCRRMVPGQPSEPEVIAWLVYGKP